MARGDHIYIQRMLFDHHAIDMGDGTIIHHWDPDTSKKRAVVRRDPISVLEGEILTVPYEHGLPADVVISRATSRLGQGDYSLYSNNCEHFARWCKVGEWVSVQAADAEKQATTGTNVVLSRSIYNVLFNKAPVSLQAAIGIVVIAGGLLLKWIWRSHPKEIRKADDGS